MDRADLILRKGYRPGIDSYSAFFENDRRTATGLEGYLKTRGVFGCDFRWIGDGLLRCVFCA